MNIWLVLWNIWIIHILGNVIISTDELHHFSNGVGDRQVGPQDMARQSCCLVRRLEGARKARGKAEAKTCMRIYYMILIYIYIYTVYICVYKCICIDMYSIYVCVYAQISK